MSRPNYPQPYCILTPGIISRIRSEQEYYDRDPERAEQRQQEQERLEQEEHEQEELYGW